MQGGDRLTGSYQNILLILIIYCIVALLLTHNILAENQRLVLSYSWGMVSDLELFKEIFLTPYTLNPHFGTVFYLFHILNYQNIFWLVFEMANSDIYSMIYAQIVFALILAGFSMFYLIYYTLFSSFENKHYEATFLSAFLSGLYYMTSFFIYSNAMRPHILFSYSLFPLIVLLAMFTIKKREKSIKWIIINGILITLVSVNSPRYLATSFLIIISLYVFYALMFKNKQILKRFIYNILVITVIVAGLNPYTILAMASSVLKQSPRITPVLYETINVRYVFCPIINILGIINFRADSFLTYINLTIGKRIYFITNYVFLALGLLGLILRKKTDKPETYLLYEYALILYIISITLLIHNEFLIYLCLKSNIPLISYLLSNPRTLMQIMFFALSVIFGISVTEVISNIKIKRYKSITHVVIISLLALFVLYTSGGIALIKTGDLGYYKKITIPRDFKDVNNFLLEKIKFGKIVWVPEYYGSHQPMWSNGSSLDLFPEHYFKAPTIYTRNSLLYHPFLYLFSFRHTDSLIMTDPELLAKYCSLWGINYIGIHEDTHLYRVNIVKNALNQTNLWRCVYSNGIVSIFKSKYITKSVFIINKCIGISGGLDVTRTLLQNLNLNNASTIIFIDNKRDYAILSYLDNLVFTPRKNIIDILIFYVPEEYLIIPTRYAKDSIHWKIGYLSDPHHAAWHKFLTAMKSKWEFSYDPSYGFIFATERDVLKIPISVENNDKYYLFVRVLKNPKGGEIKINLANLSKTINTREDIKAEFVWIKVGEIYLTKDKYTLKIENVKGSTAINILVLIPEKEYYKAKEEIEKLLQNKTIIYLFEAESDLYRKNAEVSKEFGGEASNGEVLKFVKSGEAWQDIEIVKNGTYRLALKGVGEFKVRIGDHEFVLKSNSLNFTYTPLFDLTKGKQRLEILADKNSYLDVVWLYSTKTNQTIEQLFEVKEKPAEIINYTKINPTLWKVKVNATKPFMLSFAEAYDPLWEARVYRDGERVGVVRAIPLYSVINGFWINETGDLEVVIRYKPQDWFEMGLGISGLTFVVCVLYLFYDWRKGKGDKWVKKVRKE